MAKAAAKAAKFGELVWGAPRSHPGDITPPALVWHRLVQGLLGMGTPGRAHHPT